MNQKQNIKKDDLLLEGHNAPSPLVGDIPLDARTFTFKGRGRIVIGPNDWDFFERLRELPAEIKIRLMELTEAEMEAHIALKKKSGFAFLKELSEKKWYWRMTGDEALIEADAIEHATGINLSPKAIIKKCKAGKGLTTAEINKLIDFYAGDRSELYQKENEEAA